MGGAIPPKNKSHSLIFYTLSSCSSPLPYWLLLSIIRPSLPLSLSLSPSPSCSVDIFLTCCHGRAADPRHANFGLHGVQPHAARSLCLALHKADLFAVLMTEVAFQIKHMAMVRGGFPDVRADEIKIFPGHCIQFRFLALRLIRETVTSR